MSIQFTFDRRRPARVFVVGLGFTLAASGWQLDACWPFSAQRQICTAMWADLLHDHRPDSGGETYYGAVWTMSGTSTATG